MAGLSDLGRQLCRELISQEEAVVGSFYIHCQHSQRRIEDGFASSPVSEALWSLTFLLCAHVNDTFT